MQNPYLYYLLKTTSFVFTFQIYDISKHPQGTSFYPKPQYKAKYKNIIPFSSQKTSVWHVSQVKMNDFVETDMDYLTL